MRDPLKLKEDLTIAVKLINPVTKTSDILADLKLIYGGFPVLAYYEHSSNVYLRDVKEIEATCVKSGSTRKYSLIGIEDSEFDNLCRYVYTGKADVNHIRKVSFSIPELAPYFFRELDYQLDSDVKISGDLRIEPMEATVTTDNQSYKIKLHQGYSLKHFDDHSGFGFTNRIFITFESGSVLSFKDIESLMYKVSNLFTWITGFPATVDQVDVFDADSSGSLYIPTVKKDKQYDTSYPKSFMHHYFLREHFKAIIINYFDTRCQVFEGIWSRTIPLFELSNVLEYEVMLFASVLDKYCSYQVSQLSLDKSFPEEQHKAFIKRLKNRINDDFEINKLVAESGMNNYTNLTGLDKVFPNTSLDTFIKKAKAYLDYIGNYCTEVFINKSELHDIKCIRDRAAHGEIEHFPTDKTIKLLWKLKTLIMYLIYRDLGINNEAFLEIFSRTLHPIHLNCEHDKFKLGEKTGTATVIRLSNKQFRQVEELKPFITVVCKRGEQWTFNEKLSESVSNYFEDPERPYFRDDGYRSYQDFIQAKVDKIDPKFKARFASNPYLVTKQKQVRLHSVVVIEKQK